MKLVALYTDSEILLPTLRSLFAQSGQSIAIVDYKQVYDKKHISEYHLLIVSGKHVLQDQELYSLRQVQNIIMLENPGSMGDVGNLDQRNNNIITLKTPVSWRVLQHNITSMLSLVNLPYGVTFFPGSRDLRRRDTILSLTEKEASLLKCISDNQPVATKAAMLKALGIQGHGIDTHTVESHIYRLRKKLTKCFGHTLIESTKDGGYAFLEDEPLISE